MQTERSGRYLQLAGLILGTQLFFGSTAAATVVFVPTEDRPQAPRPQGIFVEHTDIEINVHEGAAELRILQRVRNDTARTQQTRYLLPLPKGARAHGAALKIGEEWVEAELLDADRARSIYDDIVRRQIDPALVEHVDDGILRTSIFPLPPHSTREIELTLNMTLPMEFDAFRLDLPLAALSDTGRIELHGRVQSGNDLLEPFSPTHTIRAELRAGSHEASFGWSGDSVRAAKSLSLVMPFARQRFGVFATSTRPAGEDGYVMLRLAPGQRLGARERLPKDLLFVLDTSGSMRGEKMRQAKEALRDCLDGLGSEDRFALLSYSAAVRPFGEGLAAATSELKAAASEAVDDLLADGGTNIEAALRVTLEWAEQFEPGRPAYILFLTDGLPTVGEQDVGQLLEQLRRRGDALPRMFSFGVGLDVNTRLLDGIAENSGATTRYVLPGEDLEEAISRLLAQIDEPVWTDLELSADGLSDLVPRELGDLFAGQALTILARYDDPGRTRMTLRGRRGNERQSFDFEVELERGYGDADYLPKLWASKQIALLELELRDHPERAELRDRIVELATRHGIVTPYSSLLMRESDEQIASALRRGDFDDARRQAEARVPGSPVAQQFNAPMPVSGKAAVEEAAKRSRELTDYAVDAVEEAVARQSGVVARGGKLYIRGGRSGEILLRAGRYFDEKKDGELVDKLSAGAEIRLTIRFGSEAYFELLRMRPDLRALLSQGTTMRIALGDAALAIADDGVEKLSRRDRDWLATARL